MEKALDTLKMRVDLLERLPFQRVTITAKILFLSVGLAAANTTAEPSAGLPVGIIPAGGGLLEHVLSLLPQIVPLGIVVALIGLLGQMYRVKADRAINSEQSSTKIFDSVIKDNDTLRKDKDALQALLNTKNTECIEHIRLIRSFEYDASQYNDRVKKKEEALLELQQELDEIEKGIEKLRSELLDKDRLINRMKNQAILERLRSLGISDEEVIRMFDIEKGGSL